MLRRLTKTVPKQCLVYFTLDDTTAVVPTKKTIMVEGARPITKGEKVVVTWNGQGLEAYILELSGKDKASHNFSIYASHEFNTVYFQCVCIEIVRTSVV